MSFIPHLALLANGGGGMPAPFHPMLVNFTAALIPVSFAFDLLAAWLRKEQFSTVGWWTLLAAAVVTPFTALAGWLWMRSMDHADHGQMAAHQWLGISLATVVIAMAAWRGWLQRRGAKPGWPYAAAAVLVFGALVYQGELGASMSFGRGIVLSSGEGGERGEAGGGAHDHEAQPTERPARNQPHGHENGDHGSRLETQPASTQPQDHGHGEHGHGDATEWRDHIDLKE